jgi:hypothetical protein
MERKQIKLMPEERAELKRFSKAGEHNVRLVDRARIILALDTSGSKKAEKQEDIAEHMGISRQTVNNAKNDFLAIKDISRFLQRKQRETPPVPPKITGELEARIIALACGKVPKGDTLSFYLNRFSLMLCVSSNQSGALVFQNRPPHNTMFTALSNHK